MDSKKLQKVAELYNCEICHYSTSRKSSFLKHKLTDKHKNNKNDSKMIENDSENLQKVANIYQCNCGKMYKYDSGYYRHKKKCNFIEQVNNSLDKQTNDTEELIKYLMKENSEFKQLLVDQNKHMLELAKNSGNYNITTNTNSHNKSFNLQFFLNETCKNAMNITDFVNSLQLQLSDLEKVGELGYIEGISNIIIKNLNALDVTERPVHCTDKKRETMYIKDENKWEKEDDNKTKLHKLVRKVSNKNIDLISEFKELYPDWKKSSSKVSDQFNKIIIESMGGAGDNDFEKEEKIIKKISKEVLINKELI
jgi:hypothetical protein